MLTAAAVPNQSKHNQLNSTTTDLSRWRLKVDHGRQTWHYLPDEKSIKEWPQTDYDKYWLGILKVPSFFFVAF